ncbi:uncharacterized protein FA14DRAFT_193166 [Meira miltonrushii]|uniref:Mid2 domain-containing protein n=1 Tax=Meira miltonrushii TaxID=1280837 RepID=A0A316V2I1_9BASI|nr:uncharacterized protein FA14DRAFT_193166 [Meira miltonrushii]PWN31208.1 hypothetical protein FA14DRAFT_193166 [Meira miltonrushii]
MPLAQPTPRPIVPREIIEAVAERRQLLDSIFGGDSTTANSGGSGSGGSSGGGSSGGSSGGGSTGGGSSDNGSGSSNGGSSSNGGGSTANGGGGSTSNGQSSSTTSQQSSTSSPSSTREQVTSFTSSRSSTVVQQTTSNGVVTSVTVVTNAPDVVYSTASVGAETSRPTSSGSSTNGGLIGGVVGGVVGGLALLTLLVLGIIVWRRRRSRTGHGWLLCFGRRPDTKNDLDVDWPTFDPTAGAAGVGGTMGTNGRRKGQGYNGGTLPNVDDEGSYHQGYNGDYGSYNHGEDEMRDMGNAYPNSAPSFGSPTSDNQHYAQQSQQWHMGPMTSFSNGAHSSAPDYSHLDAPEVREERARQQAQEQAMAAAAAAAASHHSGGSPPPTGHGLSRYGSPVGSASPPPNEGRPLSGAMNEHRFSQGTAQMLSDNNFFLSSPQFEDDNGTVLNENQRHGLHLHNPDA